MTPKYKKFIRNLVDFCSQEFYRKSKAIEFVIDGNSHRSELRFNAEWSTNSARTRRLRGRMQLPAPGRTVEQFTWMQVHGGEAAGVPLLRLYWLRSGKRNGKTRRDALLAAVRLNTKKKGTPRWGALYEGGGGGRTRPWRLALAGGHGTTRVGLARREVTARRPDSGEQRHGRGGKSTAMRVVGGPV